MGEPSARGGPVDINDLHDLYDHFDLHKTWELGMSYSNI